MTFAWQVLEYHPEPWDQWVTVGNIQVARDSHAVLSIGPQQLPCLAGDSKEFEEVSSSSLFSSSITSSSSLSSSIEEFLKRECPPFITVFHLIWVRHKYHPCQHCQQIKTDEVNIIIMLTILQILIFNLRPMSTYSPVRWHPLCYTCWKPRLPL